MSIKAYTDKSIGRRVRIIGPGHYKSRCLGEIGTIRAVWSLDNIAVRLDDLTNAASKEGYFYFKSTELEFIDNENNETANAADKGEKNMQKLTNYINIAEMEFLNEKDPFRTYEYANYDPDLKQGDLCVVMTAHHGMALAAVVEIKETTENDVEREIVARVDTAEYDKRVERRKKAADCKKQMQERAKALQDLVLYQTLAKDDPEMAQLLKEYLALAD